MSKARMIWWPVSTRDKSGSISDVAANGMKNQILTMLDPQTLISIVFFLIFGAMICWWNRNDKVVVTRKVLTPRPTTKDGGRTILPRVEGSPSLYEVPMEIHEHGLTFSNEPKPPRPAQFK